MYLIIITTCIIYNYVSITSTPTGSSSNAAAGTIGGAVGGAVLLILLVTLCIVTWCVVHRYKRKKTSYSTSKPHFAPASNTYTGNPRYVFELQDMGSTEVNTGVEARTCK